MGQTESKVHDEPPQVMADCDEVLSEFKKDISKEYDEGKELFATAKKMYQDVHYHIENNKHELAKGNCTSKSEK